MVPATGGVNNVAGGPGIPGGASVVPGGAIGPAGGGMSVVPSAPVAAPANNSSGADMKRAFEMLGITCPTSVANMGAAFPQRAPLARMTVPRPPLDGVQQQQSPAMQMFAQQSPAPDMQQHQLVSVTT